MRSSLRIWGHALMRGIRMDLLSSRCLNNTLIPDLMSAAKPTVRASGTFMRMSLPSPYGTGRNQTMLKGIAGEWWSLTGSNRRHPACKAGALPAELRPLGLELRSMPRSILASSAGRHIRALGSLHQARGPFGPGKPEERSSPNPKDRHAQEWWARVDSNYRPHAYQACALTT